MPATCPPQPERMWTSADAASDTTSPVHKQVREYTEALSFGTPPRPQLKTLNPETLKPKPSLIREPLKEFSRLVLGASSPELERRPLVSQKDKKM